MMRWYRPMTLRSPEEGHRAATSLELLFDLVFVVAIAQAAAGLHHGLAEAHFVDAIRTYGMVFFAIWWAWMGLTWFASGYDTDDGPYRIKVLIQMAGVLILGAGVPSFFEHGDARLLALGYTVMRVGLVALWVRAARSEGPGRAAAIRYIIGIVLCQAAWILLLLFFPEYFVRAFIPLVICELLVPVWASATGAAVFHAEHIAERYGLLTIIVLGESVLATTVSAQTAFGEVGIEASLLRNAFSGLLLLFSMWWLYFSESAHEKLKSVGVAFLWGYAHVFLFGSAAAVGAGIAVQAEYLNHHAHLNATQAGLSVAVPAVVFLFAHWIIHIRGQGIALTLAYLAAAVLALVAAGSPWPVLTIAVIFAGLVGASYAVRSGGRDLDE